MALDLKLEGTVGQIYALRKLAASLSLENIEALASDARESQIMLVSLKKLVDAIDRTGFSEPVKIKPKGKRDIY